MVERFTYEGSGNKKTSATKADALQDSEERMVREDRSNSEVVVP